MINRSLIRIKTVQILYSYLLTRSDFKLAPAPSDTETSRDRRFAYSVYLDLITLLLKLSSMPLGPDSGLMLPPDPGIRKNRIALALRNDAAVTALITKNKDRLSMFDGCLEELAKAITETPVYNSYKRKRKLSLADDVEFWSNIFTGVVRKYKGVERALRRDEMFSHLGFDMGVKLFVETLAGFDDTRATYTKARESLDNSLQLAYDLYHALLVLPVALTDLQKQRLENAKNKYLPTEDDLNPNLRFVDNLYVKAVRENAELNDYIAAHNEADPANWRDIEVMVSRLLDNIVRSDLYAEYMQSPAGNYATDAAFWREVLKTIIIPSDELAEALESMSVYWNDDLDIMSTFALKTIKRSYSSPANDNDETDEAETEPFSEGKLTLLPMFMNEDDERFGAELFEFVVNNREKYRSYIDRFINPEQWDSERLAFMDIVIMLTAIAEIINYPSIPVPVTLNEYIEIANDYSTPKSGQFINGILYSVITLLNSEGIIKK